MPAPKINPRSITEEQLEQAIDDACNAIPLWETAQKLGFTTKSAFSRFCVENPAIHSKIKQARLDACEYLEDTLLAVADEYDGKVARVKMESICRLLAFRNPQKYGQKLDLNVNQNVSIRVNLESANSRINELMVSRDVTPKLESK